VSVATHPYWQKCSVINGAGTANANVNNIIVNCTDANAVVTTVAGAALLKGAADGTGNAARFNLPTGVAVDSDDNVYVADTENNTIRKITSTGVVTTLAGTAGSFGSVDATGADARFRFPQSVALDASGNVYVADARNVTVRKITTTGVVSTYAGTTLSVGVADGTTTAAKFRDPFGVAADASGNVYVADTFNHTIRKITSAGLVTTIAGTASSSGSVDGIREAAKFNTPYSVAVDSSDNVYVADTNNHIIRKITPAGVVTTFAGVAGSPGSADGAGFAAKFNYPAGVAVDYVGNVYVADMFNHTIRKITPDAVVTTLAGTANSIGSTDGSGTNARFRFPYGIAVDRAGNIFLSDRGNSVIRKITPTP
jgi:hypothetical protein